MLHDQINPILAIYWACMPVFALVYSQNMLYKNILRYIN